MKSFYLQKSIKLSSGDMSYATLPNFGLTKKATIETWVNTTGSALPQTILHKKWSTNEFNLFLNPNGLNNELKLTLNGATYNYGNIPPNFQHLAFTIDSLTGNVSGYLNGVFIATHNYGAISGSWYDPIQPWVIGAHNDGASKSQYFNGLIDELALYDTILSPLQIYNHFQSTRDIQEKGLFVYYPMNEGAGNRISNVGSFFRLWHIGQ
ncbi:MAG: LamG domain-containing protein [Saprospiraceae bacterium]|nr:LamG domain-containing protein [Saprospiraceae bacterium]